MSLCSCKYSADYLVKKCYTLFWHSIHRLSGPLEVMTSFWQNSEESPDEKVSWCQDFNAYTHCKKEVVNITTYQY